MIFKVDLENGILPIAAKRVEGEEGVPIMTLERAVEFLNRNILDVRMRFKLYGDASGRRIPMLFGMVSHEDGLVQMLIDTRDLGAACNIAVGLRLRRSA